MIYPHRSLRRQLLLAGSFIVALAFGSAVLAEKAPIQVDILAGQSNMVGISQVDGEGMDVAMIKH